MGGPRWEQVVLGLFEDLEQQAEGLALRERDAEVADRRVAEYARVPWAARVHGAVGSDVRLEALGGLTLIGRIERTGADWLLLVEPVGRAWIVPHAAVAVLHGGGLRAVGEETLGVLRRLPLRAVLRRVGESDRDGVLVHLRDARRVEAVLGRVGEDFVEVRVAGTVAVVPFSALAAVQRR